MVGIDVAEDRSGNETMGEPGSGTKGTGSENGNGIRLLILGFSLFALLSSSGCEEAKPLTPEQQSLISAWGVRERVEHAYSERSVENVLNVLSPRMAADPGTKTGLESLFGRFQSVDLHLIMDSGRVDTTARIVHFRAHWTMAGVPKDPGGQHYFQTGECRLTVSIKKAPFPAQIMAIKGDTFLTSPGPTPPNPSNGKTSPAS